MIKQKKLLKYMFYYHFNKWKQFNSAKIHHLDSSTNAGHVFSSSEIKKGGMKNEIIASSSKLGSPLVPQLTRKLGKSLPLLNYNDFCNGFSSQLLLFLMYSKDVNFMLLQKQSLHLINLTTDRRCNI